MSSPGLRAILISATALALPLLTTEVAHANARYFTYTYESAVLAPLERELELSNTVRGGRDNYYSRFDHRLEFEFGLTPKLMTAFYLNFSAVTEDTDLGRLSNFSWGGVSSGWKLKLTDPVADAVGFAPYLELTASTSKYEIETKLLFDKRLGNVLLAANLVGEVEWELNQDETEKTLVLSPVLAGTYIVSPVVSVGLEVVNESKINQGDLGHSPLWAGPVVAFHQETWWAAISVLPQLTDLTQSSRDLTQHEAVQVRLLLSAHL